MIYQVKRFSHYEGLDPIGRYQTWKLRRNQAKDLKQLRKLNNKVMGDNIGSKITANSLALDAAKTTRKNAAQKIKQQSAKRINIARKGALGTLGTAATLAGGYGLYKLAKGDEP